MNELKNKITAIMQTVFHSEQIDENASQQNIEKWDSLGHLNLIVALEEEFDVSFEPEEIAEMTSMEMIVKKLSKYKPEIQQ
jgi:acyl carrier protein